MTDRFAHHLRLDQVSTGKKKTAKAEPEKKVASIKAAAKNGAKKRKAS